MPGRSGDFFSTSDISSIFSDPILTGPGWLNLTIVDVPHNTKDGIKSIPQVCYRREEVTYDSVKCVNENANAIRRHNFTLGGHGYDLRVVGADNGSIAWAPVTDHLNGLHSALVKVVEAGEYTIEIHENSGNGCHLSSSPHSAGS
jgi:hypothetical protein